MRVVFLDFDGVLNCHDYLCSLDERSLPHHDLCPDRIARVNRICDATGARIVVTSQWRHGRNVVDLQHLLERRGCTAPIVDRTDVGGSAHRGDQIADWIRDHDVDEFVVIDDLGGPCLSPVGDHLVQTSYEDGGLCEEHVERAVDMLGGEL